MTATTPTSRVMPPSLAQVRKTERAVVARVGQAKLDAAYRAAGVHAMPPYHVATLMAQAAVLATLTAAPAPVAKAVAHAPTPVAPAKAAPVVVPAAVTHLTGLEKALHAHARAKSAAPATPAKKAVAAPTSKYDFSHLTGVDRLLLNRQAAKKQ